MNSVTFKISDRKAVLRVREHIKAYIGIQGLQALRRPAGSALKNTLVVMAETNTTDPVEDG